MEAEGGRGRFGGHRSGSRRSGRGDRPSLTSVDIKSASNDYSSSDEDGVEARGVSTPCSRGFLAPMKTGERATGRSRVSPLDLASVTSPADMDGPRHDKGLPLDHHQKQSPAPRGADPIPPHYYQEVISAIGRDHLPYGGNPVGEYESPVTKGAKRSGAHPPIGRRFGAGPPMGHGSSMSSSDNNSDTTYAESDINNSLRAHIVALDNAGTPPDPAPPEVPPRGPSHHHPLLTSQRRGVGSSRSSENPSSLRYQETNEDGYQQPQANVFLSQGFSSPRFRLKNGEVPERFLGTSADECEYLMSGSSPRYVGTIGRKSPMGHPIFGPSPTRDCIPADFAQPSHLINTFGSQKDVGVLNCTASALGSPSRRNNLAVSSRASFTSGKLRLGKTWHERLSWRCAAIVLLLLCTVLTALLTFFAASYARLDSRSKGCILVEDAAKVMAAGSHTEPPTEYPTPAFTIPVSTANSAFVPRRDSEDTAELTHLQVFNKRYSKRIDPQGYWNLQFMVKQPGFMRFNLSVPRSAQIALFGRRNVAPSITQYDFVQFIGTGQRGRMKRESRQFHYFEAGNSKGDLHTGRAAWHEVDEGEEMYEEVFAPDNLKNHIEEDSSTSGNASSSRSKRYLTERLRNISVVEFLNTGNWYLYIYNDGLAINQVSLVLEEAHELQSACLNGCSGHGSCFIGHCECVQGWVGEDCSKSVCPVLCSAHGIYGGGLCHCHEGWKGQECDIPEEDCEVPDCHGHGTCIEGTCLCLPGWKGRSCDQVDCKDPSCGGHGWCIEGLCTCRAGWTGHNCTHIDEKVFTCLPDCSGNGQYNLETSSCICNEYWTGPDCSVARCTLDCVHGACDSGACACDQGWMGPRCEEKGCDPRCSLHGQCHNGTCLCVQGWNGKYCTIPGCINGCSGNGICTTENGEYRCSCSAGWMGDDCSVALETQCHDNKDNDGDTLVDCNDSECCATAECRDHVMCMVSSDPVDVLLRKQPPAVTASFYQKVKFIIEDRNVQNFAKKEDFTERRVSVIRGQVVTPEGQGIVGVRTSVDSELKYGLTATRKQGWFDLLVNGGGAVTLVFQRAHFETLKVTVPVLWNKIIVLDPITMYLKDQAKTLHPIDPISRWGEPCLEHDYEKMRPQVISNYLPHAIGSSPDSSLIFTEARVVQESLRIPGSELNLVYLSSSVSGYLSTLLLQLTTREVPKSLSMVHLKVSIEGTVFEKVFEADPNINFTFTWNKRNVYKQKVYGEATAEVSVGYEYLTCNWVVWEVETARLYGYPMDISDIGGWNLDIHHMFNFEAGLLQRGDGSTLNLRDSPRLVSTLIGTGTQRAMTCKFCSGLAQDAQLLAPSAIAAGPDGSVYVGDFNLIRRITPEGLVTTILELSSTQVSHGYYLTVSPADGRLYISDPAKYRILRLLTMANVTDPINNLEVVVGNGERCIPGDEHHCGDRGLARKARLSHPKGLAIVADRTMYIADGTNIRLVDPWGIIYTLIGHHGHKNRWRPLPCQGGVPANQVELQWPTELFLSTLDNSLHILDDHLILQVTNDGMVRVKAGAALHCKSPSDKFGQSTILSFGFSPGGSLFMAEETSHKELFVTEVSPSGVTTRFAGASFADCGCSSTQDCTCPQDKLLLATNILFGRISAITISPDSVLYVVDQKALKIYSFRHYLPVDDENGDYQVAYPNINELYIFNRHGHHIETRDLTTGRALYSFLYSKNTSFGRLSKVTDSSGNKIMFLRDYKSAVSQIENTAGEKFKVDISRLGLMTSFTERLDRLYEFTYDDDTGLLLSTTSPGSLTTVYEYDGAGQLETVVTPTGARIGFYAWIGETKEKKHLTIGVGEVRPFEEAHTHYTVSMLDEWTTCFTHGHVKASMQILTNGTSIQTYPWGGESISTVTTYTNPLLESLLPVQARLFPLTTEYILKPSPDDVSNLLVMSYGVVADKNLHERLVEKVILVNGTRVLSQRWSASERTNVIRDGDRELLLQTAYNTNGQPTNRVIGDTITAVNTTYDRFGRASSRQWERIGEEYDYNIHGLLSAIKSRTDTTKYAFANNRLLESITLPSGRTWSYTYDKGGGLRYITTPSGSTHTFGVQLSFGFYVFSYTPPGGNHAYRQHLDHDGKLRLTVFPTGYPKILYKYNDAGQLTSVVSGDGKTTIFYGKGGLVEEVLHEENSLEYKVDFLYRGYMLTEYQINYVPRTGLSNAKFIYEYDSNFRVSNLGGRIGGQNLHNFPFKYHPSSSAMSKIGPFKISRPYYNETIIHDGTAIFSRRTNSQFQVTRLSVTIHKMEVFRMDVQYRRDGRIAQTNTYTRNFHSKPYTNTKNFTYDADGQLVAVEAKEPWSFSYDAFGNMLSLTYSTNTIPMQYDAQDRVIKFGDGSYKYDSRGAIVQNVREVNYQYDARGRLVRASKAGRFRIRYFYDHEGRLVARKDNFGNVTQFLYADLENPQKVTHIYNPRDGHLITLVYDDRGHVIFAQVYRNKYYIATDACGTPVMVFNQYGEVVREIMRSPYGHIIYDSNPYIYLPVDYCGGILETRTELVHMPGGRVYDPLIGLWLSPAWEDVPKKLMNPVHLSLYRFNGNDPINLQQHPWRNYKERDWLKLMGYDVEGIAPQLSLRSSFIGWNQISSDVWESFSKLSRQTFKANSSPFSDKIKRRAAVSGFLQNHKGFLPTASNLAALSESKLKRDFSPGADKFEYSTTAGPFGKGILVSTVRGKAVIAATPQANPIFKDVLTSVFNNSFLLDIYLMSHNTYVFYFVKNDFWKATEDMTQLNRLAGEVNITIHEPGLLAPEEDKTEKIIDVKLHSAFAIVHIRYGTTVAQEKRRLLKHSKKVAIRKAWAKERDQISLGLPGSLEWSPGEADQLLSQSFVPAYTPRYLHSPEEWPELMDDPTNIRFYKDSKRTRRNSRTGSKTRRSHRCRRRRWWRRTC